MDLQSGWLLRYEFEDPPTVQRPCKTLARLFRHLQDRLGLLCIRPERRSLGLVLQGPFIDAPGGFGVLSMFSLLLFSVESAQLARSPTVALRLLDRDRCGVAPGPWARERFWGWSRIELLRNHVPQLRVQVARAPCLLGGASRQCQPEEPRTVHPRDLTALRIGPGSDVIAVYDGSGRRQERAVPLGWAGLERRLHSDLHGAHGLALVVG